MLKRLIAIGFIFACSTIAWMVLAANINSRTQNSQAALTPGVASTWGEPQTQNQPTASFEQPPTAPAANAKPIVVPLNAERTRINADLALEHRRKGLLWYSTYVVQLSGVYTFRNPTDQPRRIAFDFTFPADQAIYDDLNISGNGQALPFASIKSAKGHTGASTSMDVPPGQTVDFRVTYKSHGLGSWRYSFGDNVTQNRDFRLTLATNFADIDFPANTLSPTHKRETANGWELTWSYQNLISGLAIGMTMPEKLQPGPLAGEICTFAPVSLLLFFFVLVTLTTLRKIELHPMNYFFLAAAFFAFHLLLAYSVDHVSIEVAFVLSSLVSVGLVVSYLRIVAGPRFALAEAGIAQLVYLILFSFSFFLKGYSGLAITIGCIITLFVAMQATARIRWRDQFALQQPAVSALPR